MFVCFFYLNRNTQSDLFYLYYYCRVMNICWLCSGSGPTAELQCPLLRSAGLASWLLRHRETNMEISEDSRYSKEETRPHSHNSQFFSQRSDSMTEMSLLLFEKWLLYFKMDYYYALTRDALIEHCWSSVRFSQFILLAVT